MASDRFHIPNASEFFEGLLSLLQHCGDCVKEKILMGGTQNFLQDVKTNINALQCDLWVMYGRVTESAQENQLTQDLELLMQVMDSRLQSLAKLNMIHDKKHVGIEIKFYNLYTFKKQVDANCIDLDSEFVDLNYIVASLIFCHFRRSIYR